MLAKASQDFFLKEILFFHKPWLGNFFPHGGFIFPQATLIIQSWGRVT
jgi:hypothetical protein